MKAREITQVMTFVLSVHTYSVCDCEVFNFKDEITFVKILDFLRSELILNNIFLERKLNKLTS